MRLARRALILLVALAVVAGLAASPALACHDWYPRNLKASLPGDGTVRIDWDPPTSYGDLTLVGYYVYRGAKDDYYGKRLLSSPTTKDYYVDAGVEQGKTYWYYVKAVYKEEGESGPSNKVYITAGGATRLPPPENLLAWYDGGSGSVELLWSAPGGLDDTDFELLGYNVYRRDESGRETVKLNPSLVRQALWSDKSAKSGRTYSYWVKAKYDGKGESEASGEAVVTAGGDGSSAGAPRELAAVLASSQDGGPAVALKWLPPLALPEMALIGYYVYRADGSVAFDSAPLNDFATPRCDYIDETAQTGHNYRYRVTAVYAGETQSPPSNEASISLSETVLLLAVDSALALVNGREVALDQPVTIVNGRTMLPFRFIAENAGAQVAWDQEAQKVTAAYGQTVVILTAGDQTAHVNGVPMLVNVPPVVMNDRVLVPLRFLADAFGWGLSWNNLTRTVTVTVGGSE